MPAAEPKAYQSQKLQLSLAATLAGWVYLFLLVITPAATGLAELAGRFSNPYGQFFLFLLLAAIPAQVYSLPLSYYSGYTVEHRFGLSTQTRPDWLKERAKGWLVGLIIGLPVAALFFALLRRFEAAWWLPVGIVMFTLSIVLGRLAPVLIFPLFYRFDPLEPEHPLTAKVGALCSRIGLNVRGVYRFNLSKTTRKANAAFTGLGRSRRVILADTLLDKFTEGEILAVLAHELGHYRLKHLYSGMAWGTLFTFAGFWLVARLHAQIAAGAVTELRYLPWLALLLGIYSFITGPLSNWISRRHEFAADAFGKSLMGSGDDLKSALERLAEQNLADKDPHPVVEALFHGHPSIMRRVAALSD